MKVRNTFIIFLVSGFWHGANWTFIAWGFLNALFIMPSIIFNTHRNNLEIVAKGKYLPTLREFIAIAITFTLTTFAWIFFRAKNIGQATSYISGIFSDSLFSIPEILPGNTIFLIVIFVFIEWLGREGQYAISDFFSKRVRIFRWAFYLVLCFIIFLFHGKQQEFIYFQF